MHIFAARLDALLSLYAQVTPMQWLSVPVSYDRLYWLRNEALLSGRAEQKSLLVTDWNVAGNCLDPVRLELFQRPSGGDSRYVTIKRGAQTPISVELVVRCRKCETCLTTRRHLWRFRALRETVNSKRTWFVTWTLRPTRWRAIIRSVVSRAPNTVATELEFRESVFKELGSQVTKAIKRLRKATGAKLRYIIAYEEHKSGVPHVHLLVHELTGLVRHADLRAAWRGGFTQASLVQTLAKAAGYVVKYISKSLMQRVRCSLGYGSLEPQRSNTIARDRRGVQRTRPDEEQDALNPRAEGPRPHVADQATPAPPARCGTPTRRAKSEATEASPAPDGAAFSHPRNLHYSGGEGSEASSTTDVDAVSTRVRAALRAEGVRVQGTPWVGGAPGNGNRTPARGRTRDRRRHPPASPEGGT